jgi:hypothetical protein
MTDLVQFLNNLYDHIGAYLTGLASLSVVTMSLIQAAKTLLPIRAGFNEGAMTAWLGKKVPADAPKRAETIADAQSELLRLSANGDREAFYNSDVSDFVTLLNATIQLLVDYPSVNPALFLLMANGATSSDLRLVLKSDETIRRNDTLRNELFGNEAPIEPDKREVLDARHRVRAIVTRSIEAFRLSTEARWKRGLQVASFIISVVLAVVAFWTGELIGTHYGVMFFAAALAGFLAPVARDILAALEKARA